VRSLDENLLILVPGVGTQGGAARDAFTCASNCHGENALIAISRSIIFASPLASFEVAASEAVEAAAEATWID
jgi:orotidine-5'-phosphate decarboxylase